jgi:hypothetical protein
LFVVGPETPSVLLAFLISAQDRWMNSDAHKRETVVVPNGTAPFLRRESFIQCWVLERLDLDALRAGMQRNTVEYCGNLPRRFLQTVREVVDDPYLLESGDAFAARWVLDEALG